MPFKGYFLLKLECILLCVGLVNTPQVHLFMNWGNRTIVSRCYELTNDLILQNSFCQMKNRRASPSFAWTQARTTQCALRLIVVKRTGNKRQKITHCVENKSRILYNSR